jgi:hypothetical protein
MLASLDTFLLGSCDARSAATEVRLSDSHFVDESLALQLPQPISDSACYGHCVRFKSATRSGDSKPGIRMTAEDRGEVPDADDALLARPKEPLHCTGARSIPAA